MTVLREACVVTCTGVATGLPAALVTGRALRALLFGVSETDPIILGGTAVLLGVLGLGAALVPARRAAGVDPVVALRAD